eukprot:COSAG02_NODE_1879_length_10557_cov_2.360976_1_plen_90_part_00
MVAPFPPDTTPTLSSVEIVCSVTPPRAPTLKCVHSDQWKAGGRDADGIAARGGVLTLAGGGGGAAAAAADSGGGLGRAGVLAAIFAVVW